MAKTGVVLLNIGSPDAPEPKAVRRYLRQFLSDPWVVDIHPIARWLLLYGVILPWRPKKTAAAYKAIWTDRGSPLLSMSSDLCAALSQALGNEYCVEIGMRYGQPSIAGAIDALLRKDCQQIIAVPLFPQYASAATASALQAVANHLGSLWNVPALTVRGAFFAHPGVLDAWTEQHRTALTQSHADYLLFSFHGLPERHVIKSDGNVPCNRIDPCPAVGTENAFCYRAQCFATARFIAERLGRDSKSYGVSFQSRLGRTPWIKPYTDHVLPELYAQGVRRLAVSSPSFAVDCLETLEEVAIRTRAQWLELGGEDFTSVPCLNSHPTWVKALASMVLA